jgi:hypothetical protein
MRDQINSEPAQLGDDAFILSAFNHAERKSSGAATFASTRREKAAIDQER